MFTHTIYCSVYQVVWSNCKQNQLVW